MVFFTDSQFAIWKPYSWQCGLELIKRVPRGWIFIWWFVLKSTELINAFGSSLLMLGLLSVYMLRYTDGSNRAGKSESKVAQNREDFQPKLKSAKEKLTRAERRALQEAQRAAKGDIFYVLLLL